MSGTSSSEICPACDGEEYTVHTDHKPFDALSCECLECGFSVETKVSFEDLDSVNSARENGHDLPKLESLRALTSYGKQIKFVRLIPQFDTDMSAEEIVRLVFHLSQKDEFIRKQIAILLLSTTLNDLAVEETAGFMVGMSEVDE